MRCWAVYILLSSLLTVSIPAAPRDYYLYFSCRKCRERSSIRACFQWINYANRIDQAMPIARLRPSRKMPAVLGLYKQNIGISKPKKRTLKEPESRKQKRKKIENRIWTCDHSSDTPLQCLPGWSTQSTSSQTLSFPSKQVCRQTQVYVAKLYAFSCLGG